MDYDKAKESFEKYINQFDLEKEELKIKKYHSYAVAHLMEKLAKRIGLNSKEVELAKIIGLLHDIGRFPQFAKSNTLDDRKSKMNHAEIGCDYLFKENHIQDFVEEREYDSIIQESIQNHNKLKIEGRMKAKEYLFSRMIRDTDKIDIFRVLAVYYEHELEKEDVTPKVLEEFKKQKLTSLKNSKTNSDATLNYLSYIYDINLKESYELLEETDNLGLFIGSLKISKQSEKFAEEILKKVEDKLLKELQEK